MPTIREVKTELRHREWAEQIQECQSSGMTGTAWCKEKGISQHTYYSRLNVVRKELLKRAELPLQQIVPLSVSQSVTCTTAAVQTQCVADSAEPGKPEPAVPQKMIVRKDGIEVEMPADISERLLLTLLTISTSSADIRICGSPLTDLRHLYSSSFSLTCSQAVRFCSVVVAEIV